MIMKIAPFTFSGQYWRSDLHHNLYQVMNSLNSWCTHRRKKSYFGFNYASLMWTLFVTSARDISWPFISGFSFAWNSLLALLKNRTQSFWSQTGIQNKQTKHTNKTKEPTITKHNQTPRSTGGQYFFIIPQDNRSTWTPNNSHRSTQTSSLPLPLLIIIILLLHLLIISPRLPLLLLILTIIILFIVTWISPVHHLHSTKTSK